MLRSSIGVSVEIRQALADDLWPVLIDISQIETALLNVAINARDAMPGGGVLLIETAKIRAGNDELPAEVAGQDCVLMSLRDTGIGMSPEVIERAFEPFFTTKEIGKGTGLGLSMVFGVVRQSGGAVRIRSRLREGTTVQIYLPRTMEAAAHGPHPAVQPGAAGGAHILMPGGYLGLGDQDGLGLPARIDAPIGTEKPIPEIVDYRKIAIGIPVVEKMELLLSPEPGKSSQP
jgi:hypothetical protein